MANKGISLAFSKRLESTWLTDVKQYQIKKRTIVVNIGEDDCLIAVKPEKCLPPRTSTILQDVTIDRADSLVLIHVPTKIDLGGIILDEGWQHYSHFETVSDVPLYMSTQFDVGKVKMNPFLAAGNIPEPGKMVKEFQVKVNLWYSPENTNCLIHNQHTDPERLELHTQIVGVGRMQKFHENRYDAIYEDVVLGEGRSHVSFAGVQKDGTFHYPWHQYFAETDCIWMSIEYHPIQI